MLTSATPSVTGLSATDVQLARQRYGLNLVATTESRTSWRLVIEIVSEPMFILLAIACLLYVLLGQWQEGIVLGVAMGLVASISVYQTVRSDRALRSLRQLTQPAVSVLRDGQLQSVPIEQLVPGDACWLTEGQTVPADGLLIQANDCTVDESILTGESVAVAKTQPNTDRFYAGTVLATGSAYLRISAIGESTELGKLGRSLAQIDVEKTPLQQQISRFVQRMAFTGSAAFVLIWAVNFARSGDWVSSLLLGLTIAMAVVPEEIPVAFSSFMALGAARMVRFGVLPKQPQTVESLGSATVICTDKTGTITQEGMAVAQVYDHRTQQLTAITGVLSAPAQEVLAYARWASEPEPYDPMERAIATACQAQSETDRLPLQYEYALDGIPPMMTHVYAAAAGSFRVAGKGAVERIIRVCRLPDADAEQIRQQANTLAARGYRVLGIAGSEWGDAPFPASQDDFTWTCKGLVALENPPKANASAVIGQFSRAHIAVKMITGDSPETASAIARQVSMPLGNRILTGPEVMAMTEADLQQQARETTIFARMFPEAKLRVIRALKANGEVVAMTGDGVNDGPALKAAHIGIAMGRRGTELAKQAASLVLVNDDLGGMVSAIAQGRRIYQNLKKAIGYIISIHIPIILTVVLPLLFDWPYVNLFSPVHIIFLELVMGPTCSIAFENEPAARNLMRERPRRLTDTFFTTHELGLSIGQGLAIAGAVLLVYYFSMRTGSTQDEVRTLAFLTLVISNIWLTLMSRSTRESILTTLRRPNWLLWLMLGLTVLLLVISLLLPAARQLARFSRPDLPELGYCMLASLAGVCWIEGYKYWLRQTSTSGLQ
ncbi:cation-translocating P-type ATPase [Spirosoma sp. 209]|uniref:cation-translocating P-type ATPase n=1 Tax=Spirosoma sp. 209 TaxID=1955701 RepID=UPI00098D4834|nr:cation-translocating P-type ATPase [Spirosoma sp. 209]